MLREDSSCLENRFEHGHIVGTSNSTTHEEKAPSAQTLRSSTTFVSSLLSLPRWKQLRLESKINQATCTAEFDVWRSNNHKHRWRRLIISRTQHSVLEPTFNRAHERFNMENDIRRRGRDVSENLCKRNGTCRNGSVVDNQFQNMRKTANLHVKTRSDCCEFPNEHSQSRLSERKRVGAHRTCLCSPTR